MKKNVLRVLALVLVAAMLFATPACTQTILVRFVDKEGNDISFGGGSVVPANNGTPDVTAAPVTDAPITAAPTPDSTAPAPATTAAPAGNTMPSGTQAIADFYKAAVNKVKSTGAASYTKKEYQTISNLNVTGIGMVDNAIMNVAKGYFKDEASAELQTATKGDDSSKSRLNGFTLTDYSKIKSATCTANGGNYDITIVMQDEDTPHDGQSFLQQVGSVLIWEDIDKELKNVSILSDYQNIHVLYKDYTIKATIKPNGEFVSLTHHTNITIQIGSAKVLVATLKDKSVDMANDMVFAGFQY